MDMDSDPFAGKVLTQLKEASRDAKPGGRQAEEEAICKGPALCLVILSEYLLAMRVLASSWVLCYLVQQVSRRLLVIHIHNNRRTWLLIWEMLFLHATFFRFSKKHYL